jgi:predicted permease
MLDTLTEELRLTVRGLVKAPMFTTVAVLSLAVGIGATTAVYAVIDATLLRPLPLDEPANLVTLTYGKTSRDGKPVRASWFGYVHYRAFEEGGTEVLTGVAAYDTRPVNLDTGAEMVDNDALLVSGDFFATAGARPVVGRTITRADAAHPGASAVAVLSHRCWQRHFAEDPGVVGKTIRLNGVPFTVVGVAPPRFAGFRVGYAPHVFVPLTMAEDLAPGNFFANRNVRTRDGNVWSAQAWLTLVGRLKAGVSRQQAEAVLGRIQPEWAPQLALVPAAVSAVEDRDDLRRFSLGLLAACGACLAIACVNLAGLLLARAEERRRDLGVRAALGASRTALARQPVLESLAIAALGAAASVALASAVLRVIEGVRLPGDLRVGELELALDVRLVALAVLASFATAAVFGVWPAWRVWRSDALGALRTRSSGTGRRPSAWRGPLLAAQLALCVPLLAGTGLFVASLRHVLAIDPGFAMDGLVSVGITNRQSDRVHLALGALAGRIRRQPGVRSVDVYGDWSSSRILYVEGAERDLPENAPVRFVGPNYFRTLGLPIVRGRGIDHRDVAGGPKVAVIDETLAKLLFPAEDPLGRRIAFMPPQPSPLADPVEIVGIARAARYHEVLRSPRPYLYVSLAQQPRHGNVLLLRHTGDMSATMAALQREARAIDAGLPAPHVTVLADSVRNQVAPQRLGAALLGTFGGLALLLSAIGLYGLLAYSVALRTSEIGLRMAIGAEPRDILGLVLRSGVRIIAIGVSAGLLLALATGRLLAGFLHGIGSRDPGMLAAAMGVLAVVGLAACFVPARRAARLDPVEALRCE